MRTIDTALRLAARSLVLLASAAMPVSAQSTTAPAAILGAEPEAGQPADLIGRGYFELALAPGEQRAVRVTVVNSGSEPLLIRTYPVDGVPTTGGGVSYSTFEQPVVGAGTWLVLDSSSVELAAGESRRLTGLITVPANATPGDHVAGVAVEEDRARPGATNSQVLISVHYRRAIAVVVAVPGERTSSLAVDTVNLSQDSRGSRAVVNVRNTGNSLLKTKGTLDISGTQASGRAQAFAADTLIPGTAASIAVPLPSLRLTPGTYSAHVRMQAEDGHALADWEGDAAFTVAGQAEPTVVPADIALDPVETAPTGPATLSDEDAAAIAHQAGITNAASLWLLGIVALGLVVLRTAIGVLARRRPYADTAQKETPGSVDPGV